MDKIQLANGNCRWYQENSRVANQLQKSDATLPLADALHRSRGPRSGQAVAVMAVTLLDAVRTRPSGAKDRTAWGSCCSNQSQRPSYSATAARSSTTACKKQDHLRLQQHCPKEWLEIGMRTSHQCSVILPTSHVRIECRQFSGFDVRRIRDDHVSRTTKRVGHRRDHGICAHANIQAVSCDKPYLGTHHDEGNEHSEC